MDIIWIARKSSLPNDLEDVILYDRKERTSVGFYYSPTGRFIRSADGSVLTDVTHWMPLPIEPSVHLN